MNNELQGDIKSTLCDAVRDTNLRLKLGMKLKATHFSAFIHLKFKRNEHEEASVKTVACKQRLI